jgi:hypothetical protein
MTTKDYKAIAAILAGENATSGTDNERLKVRRIAYSLADYFRQTNENFDRAKFYAAVGIEGTVLDGTVEYYCQCSMPEPDTFYKRGCRRCGLMIPAVL